MKEQNTIMIVDDTEMNISILVDALGDDYDLVIAINGVEALELMKEEKPDLILLDIMMPEMDGYTVLQKMNEDISNSNIPVILLTAIIDSESKAKGFSLGAVDYVTKPFELLEVKLRVKTHLELKAARELLQNQNENLERKVRERTKQLEKSQLATIYCLAALAETRDAETGNHIKRTQFYVRELALQLRKMGFYLDELTDEFIDLLYKSSPLHDIGKVGVKDEILLKPGKLTRYEFEEMKKHTVYGKDTLEIGEKELGDNSFLKLSKDIAYMHHEKWDGNGYPQGLKGEEIPLAGRLMALADVYDALISKRVYKEGFSHEKAVEIIIEGRANHFDPNIVDAFLQIEDRIKDKIEEENR
ncbi:HD-GYP domain-containing protein [Clostridium sp. DL1XJH146]